MIRWLARAGVDNPVAVNMGTLAACLAGWLFYLDMPREVFPVFSLGTVEITTVYPGASPEDVERLVTLPIEEELDGLQGLRRMASTSRPGMSSIELTVREDRAMSDFLADVRSAIDRVVDLPPEVEEPFVREVVQEWPVISVFLYGNLSEADVRDLAEAHRRKLERLPGVSSVDVAGTRDHELWIEVDPEALERWDVTLAEVEAAVAARVREVPLGSLSTEAGDYLLRVESGVRRASHLLDLAVLARPDGTVVRLSSVATVRDTFERPITLARFNGQPCVHLQVNKDSRGDAIEIAAEVRDYVDRETPLLPAGIGLGSNGDMSVYIRNRLDVMRDSATIGGLLVLASLLVFLSWRVAGVTALGIPVSFLAGIALAGAVGITMNMITMFALIIVLGMIVDDAIVVAENCYRLMEEGASPREAAIEGTAQVGRPVLATILTSVAAFMPMLVIEGMMGNFLRPMPIVVSFCLVASLVEALAVLPAHVAHWTGRRRPSGDAAADPWYEPLRRLHGWVLARALRWRYVTVAGVLAVTAVLVGLARFWVPFHLFDEFESKIFSIDLRMPPGTSLAESSRRVEPVERWILAMPEAEIESTHTLVGLSAVDTSRWTFGENLAQVWVELREGARDRRPTAEIIESVRQRFAALPEGVESVEVSQPQAGPTGRAIDVSIRGPDLAVLEEIAGEMKGVLSSQAGVRDVHDDADRGKRQVTIAVTDEGRTLGVSEAWLARELRTAFEGTEVGRLRRGRDEVEVVVKLPETLRADRAVLERLRVGVPTGARVPLRTVARVTETRGPATIGRKARERSVRVLADVNKEENSAAAVLAELRAAFADLDDRWPGYALDYEGDQQDMEEAFAGFLRSGALALAVIFAILGALFRSWTQPLVILFAIPFGATGMIVGHLVMGRDLSFMSLIGLLALSGIVVNDSLILVEFVNQRRAAGEGLVAALGTAARQRFRPIVLTSVTTMLGLLPLTFFATGQARFLQPMAISLFFGLAFATGLILVLVPCAYAVLEDLLAWLRRPTATWRRARAGLPFHGDGPARRAVEG